jgi:hypothetical protein
MRFKVIGRKDNNLFCEDDWTDEIVMPIRGDSFTFNGGPLMRIVECLYVMEREGSADSRFQIKRVTFLVEEDVPARSQHLR